MKKRIIALCFILLSCLLCSCQYMQEEDAKATMESYLSLLESGKYDELEPISYLNEEDIAAAFEGLEKETGLDFQSDIDIVEYTDYKARHSDSYYGLPLCKLSMKMNVGGTVVDAEVHMVDDEGAYKVCDIYITINHELFGIS